MISVLIPIYNYKAVNLVLEIHNQLDFLNIDFEIICIDDASTLNFIENDEIKLLTNTTYFKLEKNIGRSKIRNLLASKAIYDWLLFLDVDVFPKNHHFIKNYVDCINLKVGDVVVGGLTYENKKPSKDRLLRWVYGKKREEVVLLERIKQPYNYFFGGNFMISNTIFNAIKFDETINKYGYEDVLFGVSLKGRNINIVQINNPVIHLGISKTQDFLMDVKHSIENLAALSETETSLNDVKIFKAYYFINKIKATYFFAKFYTFFKNQLVYLLKSKHPKLLILDIYKLSYLCYLKIN
jgi:hypothetical protein